MTPETSPPPAASAVSRRLLVGVFAGLCAILALGYFLFLRTDYTLLYADLKPADASAIIEQLDAKGIPHQLRDGGTTIMVPVADADSVRLSVAGSDIPMKGSVGFELFNKSDMGLTDFAQKINYQRALQGELTRTITMMDGIETARVHLAIPERSLFRGNRSAPKAAVEVIAKPGRALTPDRVGGIQQLVASAVPDLIVSEVTILDGEGRVVSRAQAAPAYETPEIEEQSAAQNYYAARAKAALGNVLPGLHVAVRALVTGAAIAPVAAGDDDATPAAPAGRSFPLRLTVLTQAAVNPEDQAIARSAIVDAVGLDERRGDTLAFEVGPTTPVEASAPSPLPAVVTASPTSTMPEEMASGATVWWYIGLGAILIAALIAVRLLRPGIPAVDHAAFAARLRAGIAAREHGNASG